MEVFYVFMLVLVVVDVSAMGGLKVKYYIQVRFNKSCILLLSSFTIMHIYLYSLAFICSFFVYIYLFMCMALASSKVNMITSFLHCSYDAESWRFDSKASTERSLVTLTRLEKSCGRDSNAIKPATQTNCKRYASLPRKTASSLIAVIISLSIIWHMGIGTSGCGLVVIHVGKS